MSQIPFQTIDWSAIEKTEHNLFNVSHPHIPRSIHASMTPVIIRLNDFEIEDIYMKIKKFQFQT